MKNTLLCSILLLLFSCSAMDERAKEVRLWMQEGDKLRVLSTTAMINDVVKRVGGDRINSLTLIQGDLDPHSYQLVKGDDEKLKRADIIFYNGLGLEHGASLAHYLEGDQKAVALGNLVKDRFPEKIHYVDQVPDPHIWMDISLFSEIIDPIRDALSSKDPSHADEYLSRGNQLKEELNALHRTIRAQLQAIDPKKRYIVTSHDAFNYFARAYLAEGPEKESGKWQERFQAPEGLAPDSQLGSNDIKHILDHLKKYDIHVVFPESNVSQDSIKKVQEAARKGGFEVRIASSPLYGDAMGSKGSGADSYPGMLEFDADLISSELSR